MEPLEHTQLFSIIKEKEKDKEKEKGKEIKQILSIVYDALLEKGYDPISQIVGYLLSDDPSYITNNKNARSLIHKFDRDDILRFLLRNIWI